MCRVGAGPRTSVRTGLRAGVCGHWNPEGTFQRGGEEAWHSLALQGGQGRGLADGTPGPESLSNLAVVTLQLSEMCFWD